MRHWNWIPGVLTGVTMLVAVLAYVGIQFPRLIQWGGHMLDPAFLLMVYKLGIVAILVVGLSKLKVAVDWWLKGKDKQVNAWIHERDETFKAILDEHLARADRNLKSYRESYEKRLTKLEGGSSPQ
jgi:hypothetical protein